MFSIPSLVTGSVDHPYHPAAFQVLGIHTRAARILLSAPYVILVLQTCSVDFIGKI